MLDTLLAFLRPRTATPSTLRPPAVGLQPTTPLTWAAWGTGSFQVWTVSAGPHRWFVSTQPRGFAVERRGPDGVTPLTQAVSLRGAVARVMYDAWRVSQTAPRDTQQDLDRQCRAAGVPFGFLLDGPVR